MGHLLAAAVKKGVSSVQGDNLKKKKNRAFGLNSKSTFLLLSKFAAREQKSKFPSVQLLIKYK